MVALKQAVLIVSPNIDRHTLFSNSSFNRFNFTVLNQLNTNLHGISIFSQVLCNGAYGLSLQHVSFRHVWTSRTIFLPIPYFSWLLLQIYASDCPYPLRHKGFPETQYMLNFCIKWILLLKSIRSTCNVFCFSFWVNMYVYFEITVLN